MLFCFGGQQHKRLNNNFSNSEASTAIENQDGLAGKPIRGNRKRILGEHTQNIKCCMCGAEEKTLKPSVSGLLRHPSKAEAAIPCPRGLVTVVPVGTATVVRPKLNNICH